MLVSLTVGKVDAGVAVLLTEDNRLIEFPSVLLPNGISSGSIVDITVARNHAAETTNASAFQSLQKRILNTYGVKTPSPPILRLRNATQTSLVLEWDPIDLATASLKSLSLYRNGSKAGSIPRPLETRSTKISGLAVHHEYTFHLVLRTTAGTYQSEKLTCRTHKMTDLSGITVTAGVLDPQRKEALGHALDRIGGKMIDSVRIDTTHFVCAEGRGQLWEKAVEMNIPVVVPEWVDACESEGTIVGVRDYYLNADPKARKLGTLHGSSHQRTTSTMSTTSTVNQVRPSPQPPITEEDPAAVEPPLTPFPGGEMSGQPQAQAEEVGSEDEEETPPPPPPKDESDDADESAQQNGDAESLDEKTGGDETTSNPNTLPQHMPEGDFEHTGHDKGKGKEGEGDFNEVPL
ncbi:Chitin biosynthesis protein CHS5 [Penicillium subrubescens]|uniref:Cell fusion protein cfr1 n=1 Tax=Penicillium subrubescens TaxID=1316194 RepID=A0A1Q5UME7_9EURO|nr:Chitin biosynthesis protein CHS5 [Penicillium subrubescens]KAJ5895806.1 Chitin biosynthesis protein CHS5 [Penicillium subrubescens]OKP13666.1 Cell fusion protein cfr1 [Penicillium subrubescens]